MNESTCQHKKKQPTYDELLAINEQLKEEVQWLKEQFQLSQVNRFGSSSESLPQASLFGDDTTAEDDVLEEQAIPAHKRQKRKPKNGRNIDVSKLEREIIEHDLSDQEKQCACGCQMELMGADSTEKIDFIPPKLKVIEHVEYKYTCRACQTLKQSKKPEQPLGKMMATVAFLVEIVLKKFQHHLPYYRQSKIFKQSRIDIPDNTLANWVMKGGDGLLILYEALVKELKSTRRLQVDESPIRVLSQDKKGYVWCYHSYEQDNRFFLYEIASGRSAHVVNQALDGYQGILQTDGYSSYNAFRADPNVITPGCWAHARRKFFDVVKSKSVGFAKASKIIRLMDNLFDIDAQSNDTERLARRIKESMPVVNEIKVIVDDCLLGPLPKGNMGKALTYITNQWPHLILFLEHESVELSTNWVENAIRPFALGRKNWLFINNLETGKITGLFYSLIQTCIANQIEPREYLTYVLNQIPRLRRNEMDARSLLPQFIDPQLLASTA